ncbi:MAG TPA: pirin family protein [Gammaproteobacteria bacterium]|nr:pirin family protein [Gammaproteobacteria bacterium]
MIALRRSHERGHANHGWLDSYHSFSFADYYDPAHMHFGSLRVINEDYVNPGRGFATHGHRDMEIITYVLSGALEHKDSLGNGSIIRPGDVQRMSAGTGVLHSEFNPSATEQVHLLQIWILPDRKDLPPSYEQRHFDRRELRGNLKRIASPDGAADSVRIHQDARLYAAVLEDGEEVVHAISRDREIYVHVANGRVSVNGHALAAGDAAMLKGETEARLNKAGGAELLLFDLD